MALVGAAMTLTAAAQNNAALEEASLSTTRVVLLKSGQPQSIGTGFYYLRAEGAGKVILFLH